MKTSQVVRKKSSSVVTLKIDSVTVDQRTPVFFEPSLESVMLFDDNLVLGEQLVMLRKGVNQKIKVSVINTTDRDIEIPARMVLGDINLVSSITPMAVKLREAENLDVNQVKVENQVNVVAENAESCSVKCGTESNTLKDDSQYSKLKEQIETLKLDHLDAEMQKKIRDMLWRKREAFCSDDGEIGEAKD